MLPYSKTGSFNTTRWSIIIGASCDDDEALTTLCQTYWQPIYSLARRSSHSPSDAQDLTQGFFAKLLEKKWLEKADPEKGKFRSFFITLAKRYMISEWQHDQAVKRGGRQQILSIDAQTAENGYTSIRSEELSPDEIFDRSWALSLLELTLSELSLDYEKSSKSTEFEILKPHLTAHRGDIPYEEIAQSLDTSEGTARVAVHRLRKKYRQLFRSQVSRTLAPGSDLDQEIQDLLIALSR